MKSIKECWQASKTYRILLIASIVYAVFRLAVQIYLFSDALQPEAIAQGEQVGTDLERSYIPATQHFRAHEDIYLKGSLAIIELYFQYAPAFAFFFGPLPASTVNNTDSSPGNLAYSGLLAFLCLVGPHLPEE